MIEIKNILNNVDKHFTDKFRSEDENNERDLILLSIFVILMNLKCKSKNIRE